MSKWDEWINVVVAYYPGDDVYVIRDDNCLRTVKRCAFGTC